MGLPTHYTVMNVSLSIRRGTIRVMHCQKAPQAGAKLVRCTSGALYDVIIDPRAESPKFL